MESGDPHTNKSNGEPMVPSMVGISVVPSMVGVNVGEREKVGAVGELVVVFVVVFVFPVGELVVFALPLIVGK